MPKNCPHASRYEVRCERCGVLLAKVSGREVMIKYVNLVLFGVFEKMSIFCRQCGFCNVVKPAGAPEGEALAEKVGSEVPK